MTKSQSPLPQEGGRRQATEDRGVMSLFIFGPILSPIGQLLPVEGAHVTGLALCHQYCMTKSQREL